MLSEQPYESSRTGEDHHFPDEVTEAERKKNSKVRDQELLFASQAACSAPSYKKPLLTTLALGWSTQSTQPVAQIKFLQSNRTKTFKRFQDKTPG